MNERIRLLSEQCTYGYESSDGSGEYETFDKEKFAELIVNECAAQCEVAGDVVLAEQMRHWFGVGAYRE